MKVALGSTRRITSHRWRITVVALAVFLVALIAFWLSRQGQGSDSVMLVGTVQKQAALGYVLLDAPDYASPIHLMNAEVSAIREELDAHVLDPQVSLTGILERLPNESDVYGMYILRVNEKQVAEAPQKAQAAPPVAPPTVAGFVAGLTDEKERACVKGELTTANVADLDTTTMSTVSDEVLQKIAACFPEKGPQINDSVRPS